MSSQKLKVIFGVFFSHFFIILGLSLIKEKEVFLKNKNHKIAEQLIFLKEKEIVFKKKEPVKKELKKKVAVQSLSRPKPIKELKKKVEEKRPIQKKEKLPLKVAPNLLQELQKSLLNLEKTVPEKPFLEKKINVEIPSCLEIKSKKEKFFQKNKQESFQEKLVEYFRESLNLPEYGEVKLKLLLKKDGFIKEVDVLSSKNEKNEKYLKNALTKICLPWIDKYLKEEDEIELIISFINDM